MARQSNCAASRNGNASMFDEGEAELSGNRGQTVIKGDRSGSTSPPGMYNPFYTGRPRTPAGGSKSTPVDRQEIIRRIKSGESRPTSPEHERPVSRSSLKTAKLQTCERLTADLASTRPKSPETQGNNEAVGMQIERPRSALHRGDFREKEESLSGFHNFGDSTRDEPTSTISTSPVVPWHPDFPSAAIRQSREHVSTPTKPPSLPGNRVTRSRTISHASLASTFVYKAPTSPLVQASRPDTPEPPSSHRSRSPDKSRRHTFSPRSMQQFQSVLDDPSSARELDWQLPTLRAEKTFPYQAHQPRRSLNSFASLPQSPAAGSRRPSFSDSPLHHAPMVGSYEESILRGRMSTTPSKPLNFVAQIGVLGKGDCKPNLRCPPHVTVPFPAVFYSYASGARETTNDQPSPYVGLVDLENNLAAPNCPPEKRRQKLQAPLGNEGSRASSRNREENTTSDAQAKLRKRNKQKRRSGSPKAPPGGSYRIPQQGQLQIVIKNPNKTAVKLFLVPYDLSDMEPGQKTFIRQRSYSAGPIIDMPLSSRKNFGTDRPEAALSASDDPNDKPTLRYLVHLHICCPSKGRFFLYRAIRVVFANRVPDGKEKLRNEIQLPEPKYSTYKAGRDSNVGVNVVKDEARRRSVQFSIAPFAEHLSSAHRQLFQAKSLPAAEYNPNYIAEDSPLPFRMDVLPTLESRPVSRQMNDAASPELEGFTSPTVLASSDLRNRDSNGPVSDVPTLHTPFDFDRNRDHEWNPRGRSESLLSRQLKDLAFPGQENITDDK